jgi:nicotinate-nucleotide adenylyltransferase
VTATRRIGVFGGTFSPIHIGHLVLAQTALETLQLEQVVFVPAGEPPHKRNQTVMARAEDRFQMVQLAIADNERFHASRYEVDSNGPCYTINTLEAIERDLGPDVALYLLVGGDWAGQVHLWHRGEEILRRYHVAAVQRGHQQIEANGDWPLLTIPMPTLDISSSMIRQLIQEGREIRYLVPGPVARYIAEHGLYRK